MRSSGVVDFSFCWSLGDALLYARKGKTALNLTRSVTYKTRTGHTYTVRINRRRSQGIYAAVRIDPKYNRGMHKLGEPASRTRKAESDFTIISVGSTVCRA